MTVPRYYYNNVISIFPYIFIYFLKKVEKIWNSQYLFVSLSKIN